MAGGKKKARLEEPLQLPPSVEVKREVQEPNGGGAHVAAEGDTRKEMDIIKFDDATLLRCPVCSDRLRPPVFQCAAGLHTACGSCEGKLPGKRCHSCDVGGVAYLRCTVMDKVVCAARVQCAHHHHGCTTYIAYFEASNHESTCPRAPYSYTLPGCGFVASPPTLLGHLASAHSLPMHNILYCTQLVLIVWASEPRVLLVAAEEDGTVFLLSLGTLGSAMAVSVVCVRANGDAGQQYGLKLWAHGNDGRSIVLDSKVTSSAAPGEGDVDAGEFLAVPPTMVTGTQGDKEMVLTVCIDEAA